MTQKLVSLAYAALKHTMDFPIRRGYVGCALESQQGTITTGVNMDIDCGIGFCAEHAAVANLLQEGETHIKYIVAVTRENKIISPCGRCRELLFQLNPKNATTKVIIEENKTILLKELLPNNWQDMI